MDMVREGESAMSSASSPEVVLSCQGLVKKFGGITATSDVTLQLHKGARHALIGPNGAGKTTLINLLTGVLEPTAGSILLYGVSLALGEGETLALLGRNGTGKTTLMNTLAGATRQHGGTITLSGQPLHTLPSFQRAAAGIGWVPQERNIFKSLTVHENLTAWRGPASGRRPGCTRCSAGWLSARAIWARSCRGANSRCWQSVVPWR